MECTACDTQIVSGERRRPHQAGIVHEECVGRVHTPQRTTVEHGGYGIVINQKDGEFRLFKYVKSPLRTQGKWEFIEKAAPEDIPRGDYEEVTFRKESGVTVLYASEIDTWGMRQTK